MNFSASEKLEAVERELSYRRRIYARRVVEGKMTQGFADKQISIFENIKEDYSALSAKDRLL